MTGKPTYEELEQRVKDLEQEAFERKRAEEALRESERKFRAIFDHTFQLIGLMTPDGILTEANRTALDFAGIEESDVLGKPFWETLWWTHSPELQRKMRNAVSAAANGEFIRFEATHPGADGTLHYIDFSLKPVKDKADNVVLLIPEGRDITARKQAEEALTKAHDMLELRVEERTKELAKSNEELKKEMTGRKRAQEELLKVQKLESVGILAGGIAHDFNNILTGILGNISLAAMLLPPEHKCSRILKEAQKAALRAKGLTQQMLTFSKGGAPIKQTVSVAALIKGTVQFALSGSNTTCECSIADDLWPVEIDEGQIGQVIENIIINVDQATPEGGLVRITAENSVLEPAHGLPLRPGRYIKVTIKDQGTGIPQKHLSKIFDPYFTTKEKGSGLGLATAYSIIKRHDGHITVESQVGIGTIFSIYLPASQKGIVKKKGIGEKPRVGRGKILLMDDEELIRKLTDRVLTHLGYQVEFAEHGAEAIELYKKAKGANAPFDAVILDLTVPGGMGGKETIKRLIAIDPGVKAIVSSGYSNDPVMSNFEEYGFSGVISKPYQIVELSSILRQVITEEDQEQ